MAGVGKSSQIGKMRHRVEIVTRTEVADDPFGFSTVENFTVLKSVWADIQPVSELQRRETTQVQEPVTHRFIIRRSSDFEISDQNQWFRYDGRMFDIKFFRFTDERKRYIQVLAEEENHDGPPN